MIDLNTSTAKEIASYFSAKVNSFLFRPETLAGELKGSSQMQDLDLCWIRILSGHTYQTDARNEAAAITGRKLAGIPFIKRKLELVHNEKMETVAEIMATDHRTLQQTFSGLVFFHFLLSCSEKEHQILVDAMGDSFYRLPLI